MSSGNEVIIRRTVNNETEVWLPTTLHQLNKQEDFLEEMIAENPKLLKLESRFTGIRGPFAVFRQITFETPQGRVIKPDIVLFAASGHVIIVEVKRSVNPELKDRRVIAQIVDYAASFSAMSEKEIAALFEQSSNEMLWSQIIQNHFSSEDNCDELAEILMNRFLSGELNLVIACDKAPTGLDELIKGVTTQSALGFKIDLVEITPYICQHTEDSGIIFASRTHLTTEIVARTAVTVTYRQGDMQPSVNVQTTAISDVEENIHAVKRGISKGDLTESEFWKKLREKSPDNYEKVKELVNEYQNKTHILITPGKNGLVFNKRLSEFNNKNVSLFFITTDSKIQVRSANTINQFNSLGFEEKIVNDFDEDIGKVLNGVSSKINNVDIKAFNRVLFDFMKKVEQQELVSSENGNSA